MNIWKMGEEFNQEDCSEQSQDYREVKQEGPPIGGAVRNETPLSPTATVVYSLMLAHLFRKKFVHYRASTRMGELTAYRPNA